MKLIKSWIETQNKPFNSSMLKVGEMMERDNGDVLLKTHDRLISLSNPRFSWYNNAELSGRKLQSGESVTLTQE